MNQDYMNKTIYTIQETSKILEISLEDVLCLIESNDLKTVGNKKFIKKIDLITFMEEPNISIDKQQDRRSNVMQDYKVYDMTEEEWNNMQKENNKPHTPYFNEKRNQWCVALSLGKTEDGKRKRKIIVSDTREGVWQAYNAYIATQTNVDPISDNSLSAIENIAQRNNIPIYPHAQDVLFQEQYQKFLDSIKNGIESKTYDSYLNISKCILKEFQDYKMYEINQQVINNFIEKMRQTKYKIHKNNGEEITKYYSQSYLKKLYGLLHRFIKICSTPNHILYIGMTDFSNLLQKPKSQSINEERQPFTDEELRKVLIAVQKDDMIALWITCLLETGSRPSEVLGLCWEDIDFEKKQIYIHKTLGVDISYTNTKKTQEPKMKALKNDTGNNSHERILYVSDELINKFKKWKAYTEGNEVLKEQKKIHHTSHLVFTAPTGAMWLYHDYRQRYKRLLAKADIDIAEAYPYKFRHTYCCTLLEKNISPKYIQYLMGDSTIDMVLKTYAHINKKTATEHGSIIPKKMETIYQSLNG